MLKLGIDPRDPTRSKPLDSSYTPKFSKKRVLPSNDYQTMVGTDGQTKMIFDLQVMPEVGRAGQYSRRRLQAEGVFVAFGAVGIVLLIIAAYLFYCFLEEQEQGRLTGKHKDLAVKV